MTGFTALLIFVILSLLLAMTYTGYRVPQIFLGNKKANHWERNQPVDDPAFLVRAKGAHLNCLENLPLFAALVLTAAATGQSAVVDGLAGVFIFCRLGQSAAHLIGTSLPMVLVRATLFVAQVLIMLYLAWMLMP